MIKKGLIHIPQFHQTKFIITLQSLTPTTFARGEQNIAFSVFTYSFSSSCQVL